MNKKLVETWAPWILLVVILLTWQILCSALDVSVLWHGARPGPERRAQHQEARAGLAGE